MSNQEPVKVNQPTMTRQDLQAVFVRSEEAMKHISVWKDPKAPAKRDRDPK